MSSSERGTQARPAGALGTDQLRLTIVTPTKNSRPHIVGLIEALNAQTDKNFVWLVADGASTDQTIDLVRAMATVETNIVSSEDFSIYHGMNKALAALKTEYYLVVGSDDTLEADTVEFINRALEDDSIDLIFGAVAMGARTIVPGNGAGWWRAMHGVGSSHSVGTVIRKPLHDQYGAYSRRYPVLADQHFIKRAVYGGARVLRTDRLFGTYNLGGFSSTHALDYLIDLLKLQLQTERYWVLQMVIGFARLTKHHLKRPR